MLVLVRSVPALGMHTVSSLCLLNLLCPNNISLPFAHRVRICKEYAMILNQLYGSKGDVEYLFAV